MTQHPTETDLGARLDAELLDAPTGGTDVNALLSTGRRTVRRRRLAAALGSAGLVVALGAATWAVTGDDGGADDGGGDRVAVQGVEQVADPGWAADEVLRIEGDEVVVNPAAKVLGQASLTAENGAWGEAYRLRLDGTEVFALAQVQDGAVDTVPARQQGMTLRQWAISVLDPSAPPADDQWVTIDADSHLTARPGVRIVHQQPDPGFGERFAGPGQPTAAAEVVRNGTTYFLAVRGLSGRPVSAIPYEKDAKVSTLAEFVEHARKQYAPNASGGSEGLR